jgi:hypothetical protein
MLKAREKEIQIGGFNDFHTAGANRWWFDSQTKQL